MSSLSGTKVTVAGAGEFIGPHGFRLHANVHRFTAYGVDADLPKTEEYARRSVTLPMFPTISEEQIEWVADSLERAAAFVRD